MNMSVKLKRYICLTVAIILAIILTVLLLPKSNVSQRSKYTISADYDPSSKTLNASMNIRFFNTYDTPLENILLHLYPNAFWNESTAPFFDEDFNLAYPNGFSAGKISVDNVKINGDNTEPQLSADNQQLIIPLKTKLNVGSYVDISLDFVLNIPNASGRFGYVGDTVNLGNWYPIIAVYDDNKWLYDDYTPIGDPFVSNTADYELSISAPSDYTLIASSQTSSMDNGDRKIWSAKVENVRDFAVVLSTELNVVSDDSCGTLVNCYYKENVSQAEIALKAATDAIKLFNDIYGAYPFEQFNIVQTSFFIGGMEYPGIVFIDNAYFENGNIHPLENVTVHECAHQWWYASAGNDQINNAWIDEGMATYSTMLYYEKYKDNSTYKLYYKYYVTNGYRFHREAITNEYDGFDQILDLPLSKYPNEEAYIMLCYEKSAMMLNSVRELLGDDLFFGNIKELYQSSAGKIISKDAFCKALGQNTDKPVEKLIEAWINDKVYIP